MLGKTVLVAAVLTASTASAAQYGEPEICSMMNGGPYATGVVSDSLPHFVDGDEFYMGSWSCDLEWCSGEDDDVVWRNPFTIERTSDAITVTDKSGEAVTLQRCPE